MPDPGEFRLSVIQGDLTKVEADAIVNAANSLLLAGGGVCGAIFGAAGVDELTAACRAIGECPTGSAVVTPAFGIKKNAKHIIHARARANRGYVCAVTGWVQVRGRWRRRRACLERLRP